MDSDYLGNHVNVNDWHIKSLLKKPRSILTSSEEEVLGLTCKECCEEFDDVFGAFTKRHIRSRPHKKAVSRNQYVARLLAAREEEERMKAREKAKKEREEFFLDTIPFASHLSAAFHSDAAKQDILLVVMSRAFSRIQSLEEQLAIAQERIKELDVTL